MVSFGLAHLAVDLVSIGTLYSAARSGVFSPEWAAALILGYDILTFAIQPFLGFLTDRLGVAGKAAAIGCLAVAAGPWLVSALPLWAVAAVALGNALFHVGGGTVCLRLGRGHAAWPGLFVAPGAVGLFLGKQIAGSALFLPWLMTLLLLMASLPGLLAKDLRQESSLLFPEIRGFGWIIAALLATVAVRSLVGFSVSFPWAAGWRQAVWLTAAIFVGKALGGLAGDRFGWRPVTAAGLLLSIPLLLLGPTVPAAAAAGLLCFNLTMAVTLAGIASLLPGYEGFAFGLTTAAIAAGIAPSAVPQLKPLLMSPFAVGALILLGVLALWPTLSRLDRLRRRTQDSSALSL